MLRIVRHAVIVGLLFLTSHAPAAPSPKAPFARVYLALRGCTSCSHCRTAIRQMARSGSGGGEARVTTDAVEVRYPKPVSSIPLRDVIRRLAENRLHDLTLVDVLFEAEGTVARSASGATFTLRGGDQSFPLRIEPSQGSGPVRLTALVEGWREKGKLTLVARGTAPARPT
jgi:hypothetical protein